MSHEGRGRPGRSSRYERARGVTPARIEPYPPRRPTSVDARLVRLALSAVVRYEDFFAPHGTWAELHRLTARSLDEAERRRR